jgi:hypothetical protein
VTQMMTNIQLHTPVSMAHHNEGAGQLRLRSWHSSEPGRLRACCCTAWGCIMTQQLLPLCSVSCLVNCLEEPVTTESMPQSLQQLQQRVPHHGQPFPSPGQLGHQSIVTVPTLLL